MKPIEDQTHKDIRDTKPPRKGIPTHWLVPTYWVSVLVAFALGTLFGANR